MHDAHAFLQISSNGGRFGHRLGLVVGVVLDNDADIAMFGGGTWSSASRWMHTPISWCSGSHLGV
jgi:hypothetical protein